MGICTKYWYFGNSEVLFYMNTLFFAPNTSSNLKIEYWRFQNKWNLKIDFGTVFWDILTFCILMTQNPVFQQLVSFDMLSHIYRITNHTSLREFIVFILRHFPTSHLFSKVWQRLHRTSSCPNLDFCLQVIHNSL